MGITKMLTVIALSVSALSVYTTEAGACGTACITSKNEVHFDQARVVRSRTGFYFSVGAHSPLGNKPSATTSLAPSGASYEDLVAHYAGQNCSPVDLFECDCGNHCYGLVFETDGGSYFVVYITIEGWESSNCDQDCNGISDAWEINHLGDAWSEGQGDQDGDGASDYLEYMAGTDPNDASSVPPRGNFYKYDNLGRVRSLIRAD